MTVVNPPSSRRSPQSRRHGARPAYQLVNPRVPPTLDAERHRFHLKLNAFNRARLEPAGPTTDWEARLGEAHASLVEEGRFLEEERARVASRASLAPRDPLGFVSWFEELRESGPGQWDPLFEFIEREATREQLRWFVRQEFAGEAGFDDLVALTQLRMPERAKLEMARNYWDEMGRGKAHGMHGPMLGLLARAIEVENTPPEDLVWESIALANVMCGLGFQRRYAFHSVGALGVIELTAPTRAKRVARGLERVGIDGKATHYFRLHATVDIGHSREWNAEILSSLVEQDPSVATHIAEGALMRLYAGLRTFDRYRAEFGIEPRPLSA
jgi:hypothetical protein